MRRLLTLAAAGAMASIPAAALAEGHEEGPTIRENAEYMEIVLVDIKPGKRDRAEEIIDDYFMKAAKAAGTQRPYLVHLQTGEWDFIVAWDMNDGPVQFTYTSMPDQRKWMAALAEMTGGEEQAQALMTEYQSLIARTNSMFGHHHRDEEG